MQELIDRVQLRKKIAELSTSLLNEWDTSGVLLLIDNAPTIDPVKHGVWVGEGDGYADGYMVYDQWYCDQCCHHEENDDPDLLPNYCPNCGAKMSVPKNADE